jgi:hypothetical protein
MLIPRQQPVTKFILHQPGQLFLAFKQADSLINQGIKINTFIPTLSQFSAKEVPVSRMARP